MLLKIDAEDEDINLDFIPLFVKKLQVECCNTKKHKLKYLPPTIEELVICNCNKLYLIEFPISLKKLTFLKYWLC